MIRAVENELHSIDESDASSNIELNYAYKGDQFFTEFNDERLSADAYGVLDANVKYTFLNENMHINI